MNKAVKRVLAAVVMVAIVLGCTVWYTSGNAITFEQEASDAPVVLTVNGDEVRADEFASYMIYNMRYYEAMYASYGLSNVWENEEMAAAMGPEMPNAAKDQAVYSRVLLQKMKEYGLKLNYTQQKELQQIREAAIENAQGYDNFVQQVGLMGLTDKGYDNFAYLSMCYSALDEYLFGANGQNAPSDEELLEEFSSNYMRAKHILIGLTDAEGNTRTDAQAKTEAQKVLDRLNAGEDFDTVMKEVSEDPGLEGNPNGYIFAEGEMVQSFYEGAKALQEGEISGLVKSDYGYHIIKREPLDGEAELENYRAPLAARLGKTMDNLLNDWMDAADVQTTDAYDEINYKNVYEYSTVKDILQGAGSNAAEDGQQAEENE